MAELPGFPSADDIIQTKLSLFQEGDPDGDEYAELIEYAILKLPDAVPSGGLVRILCHKRTRRFRLVMRDAGRLSLLLNHYLLPDVDLTTSSEASVSYTATDYAAGERRLLIDLTFEGAVESAYFAAKFALATRANAALIGTPTPPDGDVKRDFPPQVRTGERKGFGGAREFEIPDGIIAYLTRECGGNVDDHGVVAITASDVGPGLGTPPLPKNAADLDKPTHFISAFQPETADIPHERNHWLCYDFKERRVGPTHYAIRSFGGNVDGPHPKSWIVEASLDGENWVVIDTQQDREELNGMRKLATFPVARSEPFRYIRLVHVGRNCQGNDSLNISAWEIFGSLVQ